MPTIFSQIIAGEIPAYVVAEDEQHLAFLDVRPLKRGHTLVIPKREVDYIFDLPDDELAALHLFAKQVAAKVRKVIPCQRIGVAVIGLEVPHAHIHLVPMDAIADLDFSKPRVKLSKDEFAETAAAIKGA